MDKHEEDLNGLELWVFELVSVTVFQSSFLLFATLSWEARTRSCDFIIYK